MPQYSSLYDLQEHLQRVVALNFPEPWWIRAEIAQVSEFRGHRFLELIQKGEEGEQVIARADAVLWQAEFRNLQRQLGGGLSHILQAGMEVLVQVSVSHHPRHGLRLYVRDVDSDFATGELERRRQEALEQLRQKGLLDRNGALSLPLVPQRLAVLTSPAAAGWQDFQHQLRTAPGSYRFHLRLFPVAVQGDRAVPDILHQLDQLTQQAEAFDAVILLRGGGSRLDLAAFDRLELAEALALCPLPIITGIGHETDLSLADRVAHTALKTPTAAADFLLQRAQDLEERLSRLALQLQRTTDDLLRRRARDLDGYCKDVQAVLSRQLSRRHQLLDYIEGELPKAVLHYLRLKEQRLDQMAQAVELLDPARAMRRGYTLTTQSGKILTQVAEVDRSRMLETHFRYGTIRSQPEKRS